MEKIQNQTEKRRLRLCGHVKKWMSIKYQKMIRNEDEWNKTQG
jgi:hypothetical protein